MADASGQGFTASIVNGTPNYVLADRSVLGQSDGTTGSIQYVKLVWGGSGEANLITDQGSDPTPLPISLNNSENWFLVDAILQTVKANAGPTAVNVNVVNSSGLCFSGLNVQLGTELFIAGVCAPIQGIGSNFGVTFGAATFGPVRLRNFVSGSGVTESIAVTFGVIGGTVNVNNLNVGNLNFGASGIAISGWCGGQGASLPVYIVGGSFSIGSVNANFGETIGVVLSNPNGSFVGTSGGAFYGLPVVNASGNLLGVTFSGTPSITGAVHVLGTPSFKIDPTGNSITGAVHVLGTPSFKIDPTGNSITGAVHVLGTPSFKIDSNTNTVKIKPDTVGTTTFGNVLVDHLGSVIGYSGATFDGYPVRILGGLTLSGLTISGLTVNLTAIKEVGISGGTLDVLRIQGGTFAVLNIGNISGGSINVGNFPSTQNVDVKNATTSPVPVQLTSFNIAVGNTSLKTHLEGLGVNVSGLNLSGGLTINDIASGIRVAPGLCGTTVGLGVSFGKISGTVETTTTSELFVKGHSTSVGANAVNPVGITTTGNIANLTAFGICGACATNGNLLPFAVYGYSSTGSGGYLPIGISGDSLKVSVEGVGLCLGTVTVSGVCFGNGITLIGGTANFLNVQGGTFAVLNIGNISGGTINIGNTVGVTGLVGVRNGKTAGAALSASGPLFVDLVDIDGTSIIKTTGLVITGSTGMVPIGVTWATSDSILVTGGNITIRPQASSTGEQGRSGGGTTFNAILTNNQGIPLGFSGSTFVGIPTQISNIANYGVSGSTDRTLGVALFGSAGACGYAPVGMSGDALKVAMIGVGITISGFTVDVNLTAIKEVGISGGTLDILRIQGGTFAVLNIGNISGGTISIGNTVAIRPASSNTGSGGMSGGGTTFNTVLTDVYGVPIGHGLSGSTAVFFGFPVFGVTGATALYTQETGSVFGTTGYHTSQGACGGTVSFLRISSVRGVDGEPGVTLTGKVFITGESTSTIGVTFTGISVGTITNTVNVSTTGGTTLNIGGNVKTSPLIGNTGAHGLSGGGTTFNTVLTNVYGVPIGHGLSGSTAVFFGFPVFGVPSATAMGVTFGAITFGNAGMGVTFAGITFTTTRTIISGSAFADGGGNLGIPVFGVAGTTAVRVTVEGGTVAGIFVTDAPGITIMGISSGIPVIGVSGGQPIAVTFAAPPAPSLNFPTSGITIASIASGASVTVSGSVGLASGAIVAVKADSSAGEMTESGKIVSETITNKALVTMEKRGPRFARGITIGPFLLASSTAQPNTVGVSGGTFYYWSTTPYPVTRGYNGFGFEDSGSEANTEGNPKVNLKHGLYIQLTKWDLISHVLIGYTASTRFEFERDAQVLFKEYQVAPIWTHAMDQFRRFPGFTGNNNPIANNDASNLNGGNYNYGNLGDALAPAAHKQYIGVIEKPSRIFIPTYDAGRVYIQVKGDYQSHTIGAGFWDQETGQWSDTTLYEREFYAGQISGFTANKEPNLTVGGAGVSAGTEYANGFPPRSIVSFGGAGGNPFPPIQSILNSYAENPFIRIWGY